MNIENKYCTMKKVNKTNKKLNTLLELYTTYYRKMKVSFDTMRMVEQTESSLRLSFIINKLYSNKKRKNATVRSKQNKKCAEFTYNIRITHKIIYHPQNH